MNKEKIKHIFIQIKKLSLSPSKEWDTLLNLNKLTAIDCIKNIVYPLCLLAFLANLFGFLFYSLIVRSFSVLYALIKSLEIGFLCVLPFIITIIIINNVKNRIKINISLNTLFCLLAYSSTLFWVANIITGFLPGYPTLSSFIVFLSVYGIYIFYVGAIKAKIGNLNNTIFLTILVLFIYVVFYLIIKWSFGYPLKLFYYYQFFK